MLIVKFRIGRSLRSAVCGITLMAKGVIAMLTNESTKVITAANARRVLALRVNCRAMGVPGMAPKRRMPILASGVSGNVFTKRKPMPGIRMQFATSVLANRARSRKTPSSSPPVTRRPMESITRPTNKSSNGNGRTNMPSSGKPVT
jgi:hypothetical protein